MPNSFLDLARDAPLQTAATQAQHADTRNGGGEFSRVEAAKAQREAERQVKENTSGWDLIGASAVQGSIGLIDRTLTEAGAASADTNFQLPEDFVDQMHTAGIGRDQWEIFERATNEEHYEVLKDFAFQNEQVRQTQAQFGFFANMGAGMLDPGAFALDAATGGMTRAATAGRLANAARNAAVAGATNAAFSLADSRYDSSMDGTDHVLAAAQGFLLGGALGAHRGEDWVPPDKVKAVVEKEADSSIPVNNPAGPSQSLGAAKVAGSVENPLPGLAERSVSDAVDDAKLASVSPDELHLRPALAPLRSSLSAQMGKEDKSPLTRHVGRWMFEDGVGYNDRSATVKESAGRRAAMDRATFETKINTGLDAQWTAYRAEAMKAGQKIGRMDGLAREEFNRQITEHMLGGETTNPAVKAAAAHLRTVYDELQQLREKAGIAGGESRLEDYFPQIQSRKGLSRVYSDELGLSEKDVEDWYTNAIVQQMESEKAAKVQADPAFAEQAEKFDGIAESYNETSPAAVKAREKADAHQRRKGDLQQRVAEAEARLEELKDATGRRGEVQRNAAQKRLKAATDQLQRNEERFKKAREELEAAVKKEQDEGYARKQARKLADDDGVNAELARMYAKSLVKRGSQVLRSVFDGENDGIAPLNLEDLEQVKSLLDEAGASAERSAHILQQLGERLKGEDRVGSAKSRIRLDHTYRQVFKNRFGKEVELTASHLFERDAQRVTLSYARDSIGWSALATHADIRSPGELKAMKTAMLEELAKAHGMGAKAEKKVKQYERYWDIGIKSIMGRSTERNPSSALSNAARWVRTQQFLRLMGQVGWTLFTELGPAIARAGLWNTIKAMPGLHEVFVRAKDGSLVSRDARLLEKWAAPGTEGIRNPMILRFDDDAFAPPVYGDSKLGQRLENLQKKAEHAVSYVSGMAPMNALLQRWAAKAIMLRLLEMSNTDPSKFGKARAHQWRANEARLRSYGLDAENQRALFESLRGKKKIEDIDESKLTDEQVSRIRATLYAMSRHAVLEGNASDSVRLMHDPIGKVVTQFRGFMAYSYERHLLNSAYHWRDFGTYQMVAMSTSLAALQYTARTYLQTMGDPEERKKRLSNGAIASAAVNQSSWGSIVPAVVDTTAGLLGEDPVFANTRSSGLSNNLAGGIPAVDWANRIMQAASIPGQAVNPDKEVTTREYENAMKVLWLQNLNGWQQIQQAAINAAEEHGWIDEESKVERDARKQKAQEDNLSWRAKTFFDIGKDE